MKKIFALLIVLTLVLSLFAGCGNGDENSGSSGGKNVSSSAAESDEDADGELSQTDSDMFTARDRETEYDESKAVKIQLNGATAKASSDSVKVSGSTVTVTEEATYVISGSLTNGMLVVDAEDNAKLRLVFNGVDINSEISAALYILNADKVFVTLTDGSKNTLKNGGTFTAVDDNNIDGAVFSKQDLTFNGSGSLTVTSPSGHGIVCKDDLVFTGGEFAVNCASHGLDANDSVRIADANMTIDSGKDAIHCENTDDPSLGFIYIASGSIDAESEGDGIAAGAYMNIKGGAFSLLTGGGSENGTKASSDNYGGFMGGGPGGMRPDSAQGAAETDEDSVSMKGLKAEDKMLISAGTFKINSADDSIHSNASVTIDGGTFEIASGDDAFHADEALTINGGDINISECYEGLEALNLDVKGGNIKLVATDDGLNAAGGTDSSGNEGGRDGRFGGDKGGMGGGMSSGNGSIVISGGSININASGDGIDANGTLEISGGYTVVTGPTQGDTATLDYDKSGVITGGTFIGTGAAGMAQTFSDSEQGVISVRVGNQSAGTDIVLKDKSGNTIIEYAPELSFEVVILSSPDIVSGDSYSLTVGSYTDEYEAY